MRYLVARRWQIGNLRLYERHDYEDGTVRRYFWHRVHRSGEPFRVGWLGRWRASRAAARH
jgi:hypothetical protein